MFKLPDVFYVLFGIKTKENLQKEITLLENRLADIKWYCEYCNIAL